MPLLGLTPVFGIRTLSLYAILWLLSSPFPRFFSFPDASHFPLFSRIPWSPLDLHRIYIFGSYVSYWILLYLSKFTNAVLIILEINSKSNMVMSMSNIYVQYLVYCQLMFFYFILFTTVYVAQTGWIVGLSLHLSLVWSFFNCLLLALIPPLPFVQCPFGGGRLWGLFPGMVIR